MLVPDAEGFCCTCMPASFVRRGKRMGLGRVMRLCCVCIGCHSGLIAGACMCNISSTMLATSAMLLLIHGSDSACTAQAHAAFWAPFSCAVLFAQ